jgi:anaerobic magnesium-protoporphyrin IX monomethyl ester cyclase
MSINVLFIYPNTYGMNMLPPAIALFSALLKERGHRVELFDATYYQTDHGIDSDGTKMDHLNVVPYDMSKHGIKLRTSDWREDLGAQAKRFSPDLIAVSSTEDMWELGTKLLETLEDQIVSNRIPVLVGGVFATFAPQLAIRHRLVSAVCVGEGENALLDLCDRLERGRSYDDVTNLWVKRPDGTIKKNTISNPVDINQNPMIDVSLFEDARLYRPMAGQVYRMLPVETIRGCPYKCAFCNSPTQITFYKENATASYFRKKRMDLVYQELKWTKETLGVEYNYFWADTFLALSNAEFDAFCEMYSDIRLPFWMQTRPETLTDDRVKRLAEVGLHRISFGIEHGNQEFRAKHLLRTFANADIIEKLRIPRKYGIQFSVNNITGFPYETRDLAMDTVELNRQIDADNQNIYAFMPFHGTPLRSLCEKLGLIGSDTITRCATDNSILRMPQYPFEEIQGLQKCFVLYVKFPKSRWPDIRRAEANTPEGNRIFQELKQEFREKYFRLDDDDPHGVASNTADLEYGARII